MKLYLGGTYDLLHPGHSWQFAWAARLGMVFVSLNTDEFVQRYKGVKPVDPLDVRYNKVSADPNVSLVTINFGDEDSKPAIATVSPDYVVHGVDWTEKDGLLEQMMLTREWLDQHEVSMLYHPRLPGFSSTKERAKLAG